MFHSAKNDNLTCLLVRADPSFFHNSSLLAGFGDFPNSCTKLDFWASTECVGKSSFNCTCVGDVERRLRDHFDRASILPRNSAVGL